MLYHRIANGPTDTMVGGMRGYGITISDHCTLRRKSLRASCTRENAHECQQEPGRDHNGGSGGQIHAIGGPQSDQARGRGDSPSYRQSLHPLLSQHGPADGRDNQIRKGEQNAGKTHEADDHQRERRVKQEVPKTNWHSISEGLLRIGRDEHETLVKGRIKSSQPREDQYSLANFAFRHIENVARQQVLELFLPPGHPAKQQNDTCRRNDERDADDRLLWNRSLPGTPRPAEERRSDKRHRQRNPECYWVFEMMPHQQRYAGAQGGDLREREVHENHFALHDVKAEVDQERGEKQAGHDRPLHDLPGYLQVRAPLSPPR